MTPEHFEWLQGGRRRSIKIERTIQHREIVVTVSEYSVSASRSVDTTYARTGYLHSLINSNIDICISRLRMGGSDQTERLPGDPKPPPTDPLPSIGASRERAAQSTPERPERYDPPPTALTPQPSVDSDNKDD